MIRVKMKLITPHQKAALDYKKHIFLTANAGSGKTFVMAERFIEIALNENIPPDEIAAITFTEKAAGELYSKISDRLENRLSIETDETRIKRLKEIKEELVFAHISTIHSFCLDILKSFPVEAGLDAAFIPIDRNTSDLLIRESAYEAITLSLRQESVKEEVKDLIRHTGSKESLNGTLVSLMQKRAGLADLTDMPYKKSIEKASEDLFAGFLKTAGEILLPRAEELLLSLESVNERVLFLDPANSIAKTVKQEIREIRGRIKNNSASDTLQVIYSFNRITEAVFTKSGTIRKSGYLKSGRQELQSEIDCLEEAYSLLESLVIPENHQEMELELARSGKNLMLLYDIAMERYNEKKERYNQVDFDDILLKTRQLLKDKDIIRLLSARFRYIMIDEYQDTSRIQYEIFLSILGYLSEGNLFVVGDEKQSIYMFRDADLMVFEMTKDDIASRPQKGRILNLPESFRMAPQLCLFINRVAEGLFSHPDPAFNEVGNNPLVYAGSGNETGSVGFLIAENNQENPSEVPSEVPSENPPAKEADLVAKKIVLLNRNENVPFGEMAILCRKRKSFDELESALTFHGIPLTVTGGVGFFRQQVVLDILNYLSFVIDPSDDAALAGILRSPFFYLSDTALFDISLEKGKGLFEKLKGYSARTGQFKKTADILQENIEAAARTEVTRFIRKIVDETPYLAASASKASGMQEIADLDKLTGISQNYFYEGYRTVFDFRNYLRRSVDNEDEEAGAEAAYGDKSVKIMTIHQAKGLEFRAVFLYAADEYSTGEEVRQGSFAVDRNLGIMAPVVINDDFSSGYLQPPVVRLHKYISGRRRTAEIKRLLYVGMTRSKKYLFISATQNRTRFHGESFMGLILKSLNLEDPGESVKIKSVLGFLKLENGKYYNTSEEMSLDVPVIKSLNDDGEEITYYSPETLSAREADSGDIRVLPMPRKERTRGEVFTSSQIAVFLTDPELYRRVFVQGLARLEYNLGIRNRYNIDMGYRESDEYKFIANPEARFIQRLLSVPESSYSRVIDELISEEEGNITDKIRREITIRVEHDLKSFRDSPVFKEAALNGSYESEKNFSSVGILRRKGLITVSEDDYFVSGVPDALIIEDNNARAYCFRNGEIIINSSTGRLSYYYEQAAVYAWLLMKTYPKSGHADLTYLFSADARHPYKYSFNRKEMDLLRNLIAEAVKGIREIQ